MHMSLITKAPLTLVRATIAGFTAPDLVPSTGKMASNNRQNVTWVEVCLLRAMYLSSTNGHRAFVESLHSGSLSHIFVEPGTTASGRRATTKTPHHNYFNYHSCDFHGRAVSE